MKKLLITLLLALSVLAPVATTALAQAPDLSDSGFMFDLNVITHEGIDQDVIAREGVNFILTRIITILAATVGSAAVLTMVIGGFMILISAGDENLRTKGKSYVVRAMIGLAVVLGAYIIVTTVQLLISTVL